MVVCVSSDKDNHRIFEWRSGSDVAWAETIETLQVNLTETPFIGNAWKRMVTFYWGMAFQEDSSCSLTWKAQCLNDPRRCKVWQSTNQGNPYRSNSHDLDSPEVSNFNDKKMQSRDPEHGRQPLSWTYQSPCNVAWKPLPGFWPSEFRRSSLYHCNCMFFSDATILSGLSKPFKIMINMLRFVAQDQCFMKYAGQCETYATCRASWWGFTVTGLLRLQIGML